MWLGNLKNSATPLRVWVCNSKSVLGLQGPLAVFSHDKLKGRKSSNWLITQMCEYKWGLTSKHFSIRLFNCAKPKINWTSIDFDIWNGLGLRTKLQSAVLIIRYSYFFFFWVLRFEFWRWKNESIKNCSPDLTTNSKHAYFVLRIFWTN